MRHLLSLLCLIHEHRPGADTTGVLILYWRYLKNWLLKDIGERSSEYVFVSF